MPAYALTTATHLRRAIFSRTANAEMLVKFLFHYRDHLHVLLTPAPGQTIERCAQCIKGGFSHELRKQYGGEVWQPGFHEHRIRDATDFRNQLAYIANNPSKRGLADHAYVHTRFTDRIDPMPVELGL
jgi:putative transposase